MTLNYSGGLKNWLLDQRSVFNMNDGETTVFNDSVAVESVAVDCCKPVETDEKLDRQSSAESGIQARFTFYKNDK